MDKQEALELAKDYANIVIEHFVVKEIILYGSYANNRAHEYSDIDIADIVDNIDQNILEAQAKLFKLRRELDLRIEPVLIVEGNDKSGFAEEVLETGIKVYSSGVVVD